MQRAQRGPQPTAAASPSGTAALPLQLLPRPPPPASRRPEPGQQAGRAQRGAGGALMEHTHAHLAANSSLPWSPGAACGLGFLPVVYYSLLLCLGLPGEGRGGEGGKPGAPGAGRPNPGSPGRSSLSAEPWRHLRKSLSLKGSCGHCGAGGRKLRGVRQVKSHQLPVVRRAGSEDPVQSMAIKANNTELCTWPWPRVDPGHFHHAREMIIHAR